MSEEWFYSSAGQQMGPVSWEALRALAVKKALVPEDLVWNESMPEWTSARTVSGLMPAKAPPPLPTTAVMALAAKPPNVTGEVVLEGVGGGGAKKINKLEVRLDGKFLGSGTLAAGLRLPFESSVGDHSVEVSLTGAASKLLGGFGKMLETNATGKVFPVAFESDGDYLLTLTPGGMFASLPRGVDVEKKSKAPQTLALAPVIEEEPGEGLLQQGLSAFGRGLKERKENSRRSQLHGRWEAVNGEGGWFMFTRDFGMLRADGFATKYRWATEEIVELYEIGSELTVPIQILSLGKHEIIVKVGGQSGHFRRVSTITEIAEQQEREEAERRFAEWRDRTLKVLAVGGLAVLIGVTAIAVSTASPRYCTCMFPVGRPVCAKCGCLR